MQTLVPVPMSSKLALSMLQQCTAESEEKSVVESMLEVVESLLALLRSLLAVGERLVAPSFGLSRKFARCGGHRSPESILSCTSTRSMDETTHRCTGTSQVMHPYPKGLRHTSDHSCAGLSLWFALCGVLSWKRWQVR